MEVLILFFFVLWRKVSLWIIDLLQILAYWVVYDKWRLIVDCSLIVPESFQNSNCQKQLYIRLVEIILYGRITLENYWRKYHLKIYI